MKFIVIKESIYLMYFIFSVLGKYHVSIGDWTLWWWVMHNFKVTRVYYNNIFLKYEREESKQNLLYTVYFFRATYYVTVVAGLSRKIYHVCLIARWDNNNESQLHFEIIWINILRKWTLYSISIYDAILIFLTCPIF